MKLFSKLPVLLLLLTIMMSTPISAQPKDEQGLSSKQQAIIPIAAHTAVGDLPKLDKALHAGLDAGLTINEAKEALVHLYAYCGFPRSICGLQTLMTVMEARKANRINDPWGPEASPIRDERSKYERTDPAGGH